MAQIFDTEQYGKSDVSSHFSRCHGCNRLTVLNSYSTTRFLRLFKLPILPIRSYRILDECPLCGYCATTTRRHYAKERKHNLSTMMEGFVSDADNPDVSCHALHTLMVYDEASWFMDVQKSYGLRFENHMQVQFLIAQGLCRFGAYEAAIDQCHKALELGAGKKADDLLQFCLAAIVAKKHALEPEDHWVATKESSAKAYVPLATVATLLAVLMVWQVASAMRTHRAWLVNGSLQEYAFELDGKAYTLPPGSRERIKLKLGQHELKMDSKKPVEFDYSFSLIKQLFGKHLLVINPDAMALLSTEGDQGKAYAYGRQIHSIPGISLPFHGFGTMEAETEESQRIGLIRPDTHMGMVEQLRALAPAEAAEQYARRALLMNPATAEAGDLLPIALSSLPDGRALAFLRHGIKVRPVLLPWHQAYQKHRLLAGGRKKLVREYSQYCRDNQNEPAFCYLLGHVLEQPEDARKFFLYSEKGEGMDGLGYHAIAHNHYIRAEYQQALPYSLKALEKDPRNDAFNAQHRSILLALRQYDELLDSIDQDSGEWAEETVLYLTCAGFHREAEAAVSRFAETMPGNTVPRLNAIRFHAVGNMTDYLTCVADAGDPLAGLKKAYHENRVADADRMLTPEVPHPWWEDLLLYTCAQLNGETAIAQAHWQRAMDATAARGTAYSALKEAVAAPGGPDAETLRRLDLPALEKAVLCCALAARHPERAAELGALSEQYNFNPRYPWLFIKQWNGRLRANQAANAKPIRTNRQRDGF